MNSAVNENDEDGSREVVRKLQLVSAGSSQFGIFADAISAIVAWQEPTPLPHAPKGVLGVVSIEGRMLTVLDLAVLPGAEATSSETPGDTARHLVALRGEEQLALAIEAPGGVIQVNSADLIAELEEKKLVLGVLQREDAEIKILNLKGLFPAAIQGRRRRQRGF